MPQSNSWIPYNCNILKEHQRKSKGHVGCVSWLCFFQQFFANKENCIKGRWHNLSGTRDDMNFVRSILENPY